MAKVGLKQAANLFYDPALMQINDFECLTQK